MSSLSDPSVPQPIPGIPLYRSVVYRFVDLGSVDGISLQASQRRTREFGVGYSIGWTICVDHCGKECIQSV